MSSASTARRARRSRRRVRGPRIEGALQAKILKGRGVGTRHAVSGAGLVAESPPPGHGMPCPYPLSPTLGSLPLEPSATTCQRRPMPPVAAEREILVASPRGFCAGVSYAIDIVDLVLERHGPPVYVRHEIVHNRHVVDKLRAQGAIFVDELSDVPPGSLVIFSAHGVAPSVRAEAAQRRLRVVDATCPLVTKVHLEALRYAREDYEILVIGHRGHVEVVGTLGHAPDRMHLVETVADVATLQVRDPERVAVVTQTTLSVDDTRDIVEAVRARFPTVRLPAKDDICYATQNRQTAVKELARQSALVLVLGSPTSSNANRLVEVARNAGSAARLIEDARRRRSGLAGRRARRRAHRRRLDPGIAGAGHHRAPAAASALRACATSPPPSSTSRSRCPASCAGPPGHLPHRNEPGRAEARPYRRTCRGRPWAARAASLSGAFNRRRRAGSPAAPTGAARSRRAPAIRPAGPASGPKRWWSRSSHRRR